MPSTLARKRKIHRSSQTGNIQLMSICCPIFCSWRFALGADPLSETRYGTLHAQGKCPQIPRRIVPLCSVGFGHGNDVGFPVYDAGLLQLSKSNEAIVYAGFWRLFRIRYDTSDHQQQQYKEAKNTN